MSRVGPRVQWWKAIPVLAFLSILLAVQLAPLGAAISSDAIAALGQITATVLGLFVAAYIFLLGTLGDKQSTRPAESDLRLAQAKLYHQQLVLFSGFGVIALLTSIIVVAFLEAAWSLPFWAPWSIAVDVWFILYAVLIVMMSLAPNERRRVAERLLGVNRKDARRVDAADFVRSFQELEHRFYQLEFGWEPHRKKSYDASVDPIYYELAQTLNREGPFADTRHARWVRDMIDVAECRWVTEDDMNALTRAMDYWASFLDKKPNDDETVPP